MICCSHRRGMQVTTPTYDIYVPSYERQWDCQVHLSTISSVYSTNGRYSTNGLIQCSERYILAWRERHWRKWTLGHKLFSLFSRKSTTAWEFPRTKVSVVQPPHVARLFNSVWWLDWSWQTFKVCVYGDRNFTRRSNCYVSSTPGFS